MNKPPEVTQERLREEFNAVVDETEQLLKSVALAGGEKGGALKAGLDERIAQLGERLAGIRDVSLRQAGAAARATDEYVHESPWHALGIVAGIAAITGLLAGMLISRR